MGANGSFRQATPPDDTENGGGDRSRIAALERENARLAAQCTRLSQAEARSRCFAEASADWFWETDRDHRFVWLSDRFESVTGISASTLLGRRQWELPSESSEIDSTQWQGHIDDLIARRPFRDFKYWQEDRTGRARWIKISGVPRFSPDGTFEGYGGTGADITSAVEAAHRMHMLSRAVEQCPASIVITNLAGDIEYVNAKFLDVTGYDNEEALGKNPRILNSGRNPAGTFEEMWAKLAAGDKWEGELINRRKNGGLYWEHASIQPIQNPEGVITNYLAIKTDITSQKRNEARLAALVEELRHSNEDLEQFAYVASHDLRQPLRMISAYLGLLEKRLGDRLDPETASYLGFATDGAKRLDRMIVDLLHYSRIGRVSEPMEPLALDDVIRDSLRHLEVAVAESGATITVTQPLPRLIGDRSELVRLFQNLIGNAITYRAAERPPRIEVTSREHECEWVVAVADNGTGIREADLQRVFGIFQRLVTRDTAEGTGIGLAICKKIVERHGGRIWVESTPDIGSTFLVALPKSTDAGGTGDNHG